MKNISESKALFVKEKVKEAIREIYEGEDVSFFDSFFETDRHATEVYGIVIAEEPEELDGIQERKGEI